jgi:hypothetical protein
MGERRQEADLSLGQVFPCRDRPDVRFRIFDDRVAPSSRACIADRVTSSMVWPSNGVCEIPCRRCKVDVKPFDFATFRRTIDERMAPSGPDRGNALSPRSTLATR